MDNWQVLLVEPAKNVIFQIGQFLVNVLLVIVILIGGWVISKLIRTLVIRALRTIRIDQISSRIELDDLLAKGGINYSLSELIGVICYWLALLVTFVVAINALGLTIAADLLNRVVLYIPNIIAAIFILILGMFVATLLRNIVQTAANNAGISQANLLSKIVDVVIIIFAIAIALEQLNIGAKIIELTTTIVLGSLGLGAALAFGLGCKDIAAKSVSELLNNIKSKK
jgi:hypothetical protein